MSAKITITIVDEPGSVGTVQLQINYDAEPGPRSIHEESTRRQILLKLRRLFLNDPHAGGGYGEGATFEDAKMRLNIGRDIRKAGEP